MPKVSCQTLRQDERVFNEYMATLGRPGWPNPPKRPT